MSEIKPQHRGLIRQQAMWKSGETTTIRIPKVFKDKLIEIARQLDEQYEEKPQQ